MSLDIKIGDDYTITNDKYQYMLNKALTDAKAFVEDALFGEE